MGFAIGNLDTIAHKRGDFGAYSIQGSWVRDANGKQGWLITVEGLIGGSCFTVVDGELHRSGRHYGSGPEGRAVVETDPEIAEIGAPVRQAIFEAIGKWERDDLENMLGVRMSNTK